MTCEAICPHQLRADHRRRGEKEPAERDSGCRAQRRRHRCAPQRHVLVADVDTERDRAHDVGSEAPDDSELRRTRGTGKRGRYDPDRHVEKAEDYFRPEPMSASWCFGGGCHRITPRLSPTERFSKLNYPTDLVIA